MKPVRNVLFLLTCGILSGCVGSVSQRIIPVANPAERSIENYALASNDVITISVFQEPDMTTQQQVARDGSVSFPLIGRVTVGGKSLAEAERIIAQRLAQGYLSNPQVSIAVTQYAPQTYTILGQVGAPGAYPVPPEEEVFTLPMAVARAGGNTRIGNLRNIRVNRRQGDQVIQYTINMFSTDGQQFVIKRGDLITVQETLF